MTIGDLFIVDGELCEVVWTGGRDNPLMPTVHQRPEGSSLPGEHSNARRAKRDVPPRAPGSFYVNRRTYRRDEGVV